MEIIFDFIGSLGIFLYSLEVVSKESQKVFGENIKAYLRKLTENKYKAILTGAVVTGIVQSSSVVSVLIVNLVNSGILTLKDSIGLILGTNIGTTATGWIFSIKITIFAIPMIAIGSIIYLFSKKEIAKSKGKFILGFGLLLLGLQSMGSSIDPLRNNPEFIKLFTIFKADTYLNIVKVVSIGALVTAIIQSSSAAIGIVLTLALQNLINLETILALILGANIGTTITPIISAINSSYEAKRTAVLCFFIKFILGVFFILIFPWYFKSVDILTQSYGVAIKIAVANTLVNVLNTIIFLPFFDIIDKIFSKLYSGKIDKKIVSETELNSFLEITSETMINIFNKEIIKIMHITKEIFITDKENKKKLYEKLKSIKQEIVSYLYIKVNTLEKNIDSFQINIYIKMLIELEIVAKYLLEIDKEFSKNIFSKDLKNYYKILKIIYSDITVSYEEKERLEYKDIFENLNYLEKEIEKYEIKNENLEELKVITFYKRIIRHLKDLIKNFINVKNKKETKI